MIEGLFVALPPQPLYYKENKMKLDYRKITDILHEIKKLIKEILVKNGGMDNGYETYAEGTVEKGYSGGIIPCVPGGDITRNQLNAIGHKVENAIKKKYADIIEGGLTIEIKQYHLEYGCFTHTISLSRGPY